MEEVFKSMIGVNKRPIKVVCALHAIEYGIDKNWKEAEYHTGYCDICEAQGDKEKPQGVARIEQFNGVDGEIFTKLTEVNPGQFKAKKHTPKYNIKPKKIKVK